MRSRRATDTSLQVDLIDAPDLTDTLQRYQKRIVGHGSFGIVYHCYGTWSGEAAVKAITFPLGLDHEEKDVFIRKMSRELGIWRRLDHPNIVLFLGTARGEDFGSDHPCMVSMWMPHGTLVEYVKQRGAMLSLPSRVQLINGSASGLEYLHSNGLVHGDFHPGNILIDGEHNACLTDFGFSQTFSPEQDQLFYLWIDAIRPGAVMWAAPELVYPDLCPDYENGVTLNSNIYSLGSIALFTLSGNFPWQNRADAENKLRAFQNPPRPTWPAYIPDTVWNFLERCWSPKLPRNRPSAQEVLLFSRDKLEQLLQPSSASDINVVLFGALGCGKSSIINLLSEEPVAHVSADVEPCTKRPQWYQISIGERRIRLWDTMGFSLADGGDSSHLLPYEQAHAVLRNLPDGVNLILLCARKDRIFTSLGSLYRLINGFFYGGRAPIAFVVTDHDTPDEQWWERNQDIITRRTGIPVQAIPRVCVSTVRNGCDQSKKALKELLQTYATAITPMPPCLDLSSHTIASVNLHTHCGLDHPEATTLVEKFSRPLRTFNVIFFGQTGVGKSSVINLIVGHPIAKVSSGPDPCTLDARAYTISTGMQRFQIWDTVGFGPTPIGHGIPDTRAVRNATQLIRSLSRGDGIDLIVFVKTCGRLTPSERNCYSLFEEVLCEGKVPAALIVTCLESQSWMEKWWEVNGNDLVKSMGGMVIDHACITSLASHDPDDIQPDRKLLESRLTVQAMLEDCVSPHCSRAPLEGISAKLSLKTTGRWVMRKMKMIGTLGVDEGAGRGDSSVSRLYDN